MLGRFITIEGIDGAGKSTQTESLLKHLADQGVSVLHTREPGGPPLAVRMRARLRGAAVARVADGVGVWAARADHVRRVIRPTLESGRWVLSDRFTDATYAYQVGGKGFSGEKVEALENWTLGGFAPDLTLLFDIAPAVAAARLRARAGDQDRFERMGEAFFTRVREAYLARAAAAPERFLIIDADRPAKDVSADIFARISSWL